MTEPKDPPFLFPGACPWVPIEERPIGGGGQADVFRVKHRHGTPPGIWALKRLKNPNEKSLARFHQEVEALRKIDHPSIVKIVDASKPADEFQFYVMEYVENSRSLTDVINSDDNPFKGNAIASLRMFIQLLEALTVFHAKGTIHRDLSPNNLLVLSDNSIRIIDFGICQVENGIQVTTSNEGFGTRCYNPPECGAGSTQPVNDQADIYSAGKILWSAIVGAWAFEREAPVFDNKSMLKHFPKNQETWHLQEVFENTIRELPSDRWGSANLAILGAYGILDVIYRGFPPIEKVAVMCPSCGYETVHEANRLPNELLNMGGESLSIKCCGRCGFVVLRNNKVLAETRAKSRNLR